MDAPSCTEVVDLSLLRDRLDDLDRRRLAALAQPATTACAIRRRQLEAMRFELAEAEWHLARLESTH